jgi:hypothetical protein
MFCSVCSCDFPVGLHRWSLHRHPIHAPRTSCSGCVGWFLESVIGRILDSGCRIEKVVGFLCLSSGCTTYLSDCSQLFILADLSATYLVQDPTS